MQTIHKYQLAAVESITIHTPAQIEPLCIALQNGVPCLWARVEDNEGLVTRKVFCVDTGNAVPPGTVYLGTVQMGVYVWHFFLEVLSTPQKEQIDD